MTFIDPPSAAAGGAQGADDSSPLPGSPVPYFLDAGDGERAVLFDQLITVLLSADETQGQYGVFTLQANSGRAIPTHSHSDVHEIFFVLDGEVRVWVQSDAADVSTRTERLLTPGDFGYVPAGNLHTFRVEADGTKILGVNTGGFERFFAAAGQPTASREVPQRPFIPSPERLSAAAEAFHNEFHHGVRLDIQARG